MSVREQLKEPIFRVTNLRRELIDCYQVFGLGIALGFIVATLIWK